MIGHFSAQVRLIVLETDVVARTVLLDQIVFEDQRFFLAARDQHVEVADPFHQEAHLEAGVAAFAEVGAHARAQRLGLADVQDFTRGFSPRLSRRCGRAADRRRAPRGSRRACAQARRRRRRAAPPTTPGPPLRHPPTRRRMSSLAWPSPVARHARHRRRPRRLGSSPANPSAGGPQATASCPARRRRDRWGSAGRRTGRAARRVRSCAPIMSRSVALARSRRRGAHRIDGFAVEAGCVDGFGGGSDMQALRRTHHRGGRAPTSSCAPFRHSLSIIPS